jgi:hypothetical protein
MRKALSSVLFLVVAGCASVPSSTAPSVEQQWSAYQASIREQRDAGVMNAVGAEDAMSQKYRELFGPDPVMEGAFAYGRYLYASADAGSLPVRQADIFASARVYEIEQRRRARVSYNEWFESRYPPLDVNE